MRNVKAFGSVNMKHITCLHRTYSSIINYSTSRTIINPIYSTTRNRMKNFYSNHKNGEKSSGTHECNSIINNQQHSAHWKNKTFNKVLKKYYYQPKKKSFEIRNKKKTEGKEDVEVVVVRGVRGGEQGKNFFSCPHWKFLFHTQYFLLANFIKQSEPNLKWQCNLQLLKIFRKGDKKGIYKIEN